jgi:hypothetical protein
LADICIDYEACDASENSVFGSIVPQRLHFLHGFARGVLDAGSLIVSVTFSSFCKMALNIVTFFVLLGTVHDVPGRLL